MGVHVADLRPRRWTLSPLKNLGEVETHLRAVEARTAEP
jgi:hypothetical protein